MSITVKSWLDFQHYKDRSPPWIKLHKSLLDNYEFQCLPVASRALAPMLWLLASESNDGEIPSDMKKIAFRLRMTEKEVVEAMKPLIDAGFLVVDSCLLADCYQGATSETEVETEAEKEKRPRESANRGTRLADDWQCPDDWLSDALAIKPTWSRQHALSVADGFRDYWIAAPGAKGRKTDWRATWRNWVRNQRDAPHSAAPPRKSVQAEREAVSYALTGRKPSHEQANTYPRDITGESFRVA